MGSPITLPEALDRAAHSPLGYTFIGSHGETYRSYADLQQSCFRVARALRESGLRPGDLVALVIGDSELFITALLGSSLARLIPASLYPPAATTELARYLDVTGGILRASGARAVLTTSRLAEEFREVMSTCPELRLVLAIEQLDAPATPPDGRPSPDDIAFVQFTSGSTSMPKGVALTHASVAANVRGINGPTGLGTTPDDKGVSWLPLYHDMGLVGMTLGALYTSLPCVLMPPQMFVKRPAEWLKAISRHRGTISFAPNFAYDLAVRRVKDRELEGLDLSCWRVAGCGAEPIHAPTLEAFARRFGPVGFRATAFLPSYGLAEHVLAATFPPRLREPRIEVIDSERLTKRREAVPATGPKGTVSLVCCGRPMPGHTLRVVLEDGSEAAERQVGEITLAGPSVMLGYYRDETLTAEVLRDGWLHTGDLGYLSDGELFICGRLKELIIVNGRKFHPQDLEWAVCDVAGIRRGKAVAFGTTDAGTADKVVFVIEASAAGAGSELADAVRRRIGEVFGLLVDDVLLVPSGTIGRTTSGKLQRAAMKTRYERGALSDRSNESAGLRA